MGGGGWEGMGERGGEGRGGEERGGEGRGGRFIVLLLKLAFLTIRSFSLCL
jgi:hypothetical protein